MSLRDALARRLRGPYRALGRLDARLHDVQSRGAGVDARLAALAERQHRADERLGELAEAVRALEAELRPALALLRDEMAPALRAVVAEEAENRRRLHRLRAEPDYEAAWSKPRPLVTVAMPTRGRPELIRTRSMPSVLAQTYGELEVIVVGDDADPETEEAVRSFGDPRIRYERLNRRHPFTSARQEWLVGAAHPRNEAIRLATGRWVLQFDDDDELHPDCVERLVERARAERAEAVYARCRAFWDADDPTVFGEFPPRRGHFSWAAGIFHTGLRFLNREFVAADLDMPGDWYLAERMLRIGVRFAMIEDVLCDVYPSPASRAVGDGADSTNERR